jgi:hypothetical protein
MSGVRGYRQGVPAAGSADFGGSLLQRVAGASNQGNIHTLARQHTRNGLTDATARPGDDRRLAEQFEVHQVRRSCRN